MTNEYVKEIASNLNGDKIADQVEKEFTEKLKLLQESAKIKLNKVTKSLEAAKSKEEAEALLTQGRLINEELAKKAEELDKEVKNQLVKGMVSQVEDAKKAIALKRIRKHNENSNRMKTAIFLVFVIGLILICILLF